jgi:hypothetical protein
VGRLEVDIRPSNPVPYSGQPITDVASCNGRPHTWFYDQVIRETGGAQVTLTERVNSFDGVASSPTNPGLTVPANGSVTVTTRWCSATDGPHTAQSNFSGRDASGNAVTLTGPVVQLRAK